MSTADHLRRLADLVDRIEDEDVTVHDVVPQVDREDGLVAEVTLELPARSGSEGAAESATEETGTSTDEGTATAPDDTGTPTDEEPVTAPDDADATEGTTATTGAASAEPARMADAAVTDRGVEPDTDGDGADDADDDPPVACRHPGCEERFDTEHGMRVHAAKVHRSDEGGGPAYTDPAALREAYEHGDTFAEMTAYLDVDVTPATVRRHMVAHGVHEPNSRQGSDLADVDAAETERTDSGDESATESEDAGADETETADAGAAETETADAGTEEADAADGTGDAAEPTETGGAPDASAETAPGDDESLPDPGEDLSTTLDAVGDRVDESVDLPDGVALPAVVEAVESGKTLRDVSRRLGLDRGRTRALLDDLGLSDLVTGRLAERPSGEEATARIDARLRRLADEGAEEAH